MRIWFFLSPKNKYLYKYYNNNVRTHNTRIVFRRPAGHAMYATHAQYSNRRRTNQNNNRLLLSYNIITENLLYDLYYIAGIYRSKQHRSYTIHNSELVEKHIIIQYYTHEILILSLYITKK